MVFIFTVLETFRKNVKKKKREMLQMTTLVLLLEPLSYERKVRGVRLSSRGRVHDDSIQNRGRQDQEDKEVKQSDD